MLGTVQGPLLHFSQKSHLVKQLYKCEVKVPKVQKTAILLEINTMLSKEMDQTGPRKKAVYIPPYISQER